MRPSFSQLWMAQKSDGFVSKRVVGRSLFLAKKTAPHGDAEPLGEGGVEFTLNSLSLLRGGIGSKLRA